MEGSRHSIQKFIQGILHDRQNKNHKRIKKFDRFNNSKFLPFQKVVIQSKNPENIIENIDIYVNNGSGCSKKF